MCTLEKKSHIFQIEKGGEHKQGLDKEREKTLIVSGLHRHATYRETGANMADDGVDTIMEGKWKMIRRSNTFMVHQGSWSVA